MAHRLRQLIFFEIRHDLAKPNVFHVNTCEEVEK